MRRMKKILIALFAAILVVPSFLTTASTDDKKPEENVDSEKIGQFSSKDEVVYATLSASGNREEIYVVNTLDVVKEGAIVDYGSYTALKNLTDLSEIEQIGDQIKFTAPVGKFYYQGNMVNESLPWNFSISYFLDGREIAAEELAGKDGHVEIRIGTSRNEEVDPLFFENYLLQISMSFDTSIFSKLKAEDGMITTAGKNKQVTFTVMPEKEKIFVVEGEAVNFEFDGINIAGIPSNMAIDIPNPDEMTEDMESLANGIRDLHDGVSELKNGVSELNDGMKELHKGSEQYKNGISELNDGSSEIISGSEDIMNALEGLNQSLQGDDNSTTGDLHQLAHGLTQAAAGLQEIKGLLDSLQNSYGEALQSLEEAVMNIPNYTITEQEKRDLNQSNANQQVIEKLLEMYTAAKNVKNTYTNIKQDLITVAATLDGVIISLEEIANNLEATARELTSSLDNGDGANEFRQLQEGIAMIASNYQLFHNGLVDFTGGVGQLSTSYEGLHGGIGELFGGMDELEDGVEELHDGTEELHESTRDLPEQMQKEIDEMTGEFDKSDFDPISFVSTKNEKINSVQFVFKTESIQLEEPEREEEIEEEEKGIVDRFLDLFR